MQPIPKTYFTLVGDGTNQKITVGSKENHSTITQLVQHVIANPESVSYAQAYDVRKLFYEQLREKPSFRFYIQARKLLKYIGLGRDIEGELTAVFNQKIQTISLSDVLDLIPEFTRIQDQKIQDEIRHFVSNMKLKPDHQRQLAEKLKRGQLEAVFAILRSNKELMRRYPELAKTASTIPGQIVRSGQHTTIEQLKARSLSLEPDQFGQFLADLHLAIEEASSVQDKVHLFNSVFSARPRIRASLVPPCSPQMIELGELILQEIDRLEALCRLSDLNLVPAERRAIFSSEIPPLPASGYTSEPYFMPELGLPPIGDQPYAFRFARENKTNKLVALFKNPFSIVDQSDTVILGVEKGELVPRRIETPHASLVAMMYLLRTKQYLAALKLMPWNLFSSYGAFAESDIRLFLGMWTQLESEGGHDNEKEQLFFRFAALILAKNGRGILPQSEREAIIASLRARKAYFQGQAALMSENQDLQNVVSLLQEGPSPLHIEVDEVSFRPPRRASSAQEAVAHPHFDLDAIQDPKKRASFKRFAESLGCLTSDSGESAFKEVQDHPQIGMEYLQMVQAAYQKAIEESIPPRIPEDPLYASCQETLLRAQIGSCSLPDLSNVEHEVQKAADQAEKALLFALTEVCHGRKVLSIQEALVLYAQRRLPEEVLQDRVYQYLVAVQQKQKLERVKQAVRSLQSSTDDGSFQEQKKVVEHLMAQTVAYGDQKKHPEYHVLEVLLGIFIYKEQYDSIERLSDPNMNSLVQLLMGKGKTSVMLPLLALLRADGEHLSSVMVPDHLLKETLQKLREILGRDFDRFITELAVPQEGEITLETLLEIESQIERVRRDRGCLIMNPTKKHQLINEFTRLSEALEEMQKVEGQAEETPETVSRRQQLELRLLSISRISAFCEKYETVMGDEIDDMLKTTLEFVVSVGKPSHFDSVESTLLTELVTTSIKKAPEKGIDLDFAKETPGSDRATFMADKYQEEGGLKDALVHRAIEMLSDTSLVGLAEAEIWKRELENHRTEIATYLSISSKTVGNRDEVERAMTYVSDLKEVYPQFGAQLRDRLASLRFCLHTLLPQSFFQSWNKRYGLDREKKKPLAVPFSAPECPTQSQYSNPLEQLVYTIQARVKEHFLSQETFEEAPFKERLAQEIYDKVLVYPGHIASNPHKLVDASHSVSGCTGTSWNTETLPGFDHVHPDLKKQVGLQMRLEEKEVTGEVQVVENRRQTRHDLLREWICQKEDTPLALLDTGGWLRGLSLDRFVDEILLSRRDIEAVVYYDEQGMLRGKSREGEIQNPASIPEEKRFSIYTEQYTVGKDLSQFPTARAIMTIDKTMILRDGEQGIYRFRGIEAFQRCTILIDKETAEAIDHLIGPAPASSLPAGQPSPSQLGRLLRFLISNQVTRRLQESYQSSRPRVRSFIEGTLRRTMYRALLQSPPHFGKAQEIYKKGRRFFIQTDERSNWDKYGDIPERVSREIKIEKDRERYEAELRSVLAIPEVHVLVKKESEDTPLLEEFKHLINPAHFEEYLIDDPSQEYVGITQQVFHRESVQEELETEEAQQVEARRRANLIGISQSLSRAQKALRMNPALLAACPALLEQREKEIRALEREGQRQMRALGSVKKLERDAQDLQRRVDRLKQECEQFKPFLQQVLEIRGLLAQPIQLALEGTQEGREYQQEFQRAERVLQETLSTVGQTLPFDQAIRFLAEINHIFRARKEAVVKVKDQLRHQLEEEKADLVRRLQEANVQDFDLHRLEVREAVLSQGDALLIWRQAKAEGEAVLLREEAAQRARLHENIRRAKAEAEGRIRELDQLIAQVAGFSEAQRQAVGVFQTALQQEQEAARQAELFLSNPANRTTTIRFQLDEGIVIRARDVVNQLQALHTAAATLQAAKEAAPAEVQPAMQAWINALSSATTPLEYGRERELKGNLLAAIRRSDDKDALSRMMALMTEEWSDIRACIQEQVAFLEKRTQIQALIQQLLRQVPHSSRIVRMQEMLSSPSLSSEELNSLAEQVQSMTIVADSIDALKQSHLRDMEQFSEHDELSNAVRTRLEREWAMAVLRAEEALLSSKALERTLHEMQDLIRETNQLTQKRRQADEWLTHSLCRFELPSTGGLRQLIEKGKQLDDQVRACRRSEVLADTGDLPFLRRQLVHTKEQLDEAVERAREYRDQVLQSEAGQRCLEEDKQEVGALHGAVIEAMQSDRVTDETRGDMLQVAETLDRAAHATTMEAFLESADKEAIRKASQYQKETIEAKRKDKRKLSSLRQAFMQERPPFALAAARKRVAGTEKTPFMLAQEVQQIRSLERELFAQQALLEKSQNRLAGLHDLSHLPQAAISRLEELERQQESLRIQFNEIKRNEQPMRKAKELQEELELFRAKLSQAESLVAKCRTLFSHFQAIEQERARGQEGRDALELLRALSQEEAGINFEELLSTEAEGWWNDQLERLFDHVAVQDEGFIEGITSLPMLFSSQRAREWQHRMLIKRLEHEQRALHEEMRRIVGAFDVTGLRTQKEIEERWEGFQRQLFEMIMRRLGAYYGLLERSTMAEQAQEQIAIFQASILDSFSVGVLQSGEKVADRFQQGVGGVTVEDQQRQVHVLSILAHSTEQLPGEGLSESVREGRRLGSKFQRILVELERRLQQAEASQHLREVARKVSRVAIQLAPNVACMGVGVAMKAVSTGTGSIFGEVVGSLGDQLLRTGYHGLVQTISTPVIEGVAARLPTSLRSFGVMAMMAGVGAFEEMTQASLMEATSRLRLHPSTLVRWVRGTPHAVSKAVTVPTEGVHEVAAAAAQAEAMQPQSSARNPFAQPQSLAHEAPVATPAPQTMRPTGFEQQSLAHEAPVATPAPQTMRPTGFELPTSLPSEAPVVHAPQSTLADAFQEVAEPVQSVEAGVAPSMSFTVDMGVAERRLGTPIGMQTGVDHLQQAYLEELIGRVERVVEFVPLGG